MWSALLDETPLAGRAEDDAHVAASTIKLPLAMAAYRLHEQGRLDLDAEVAVHDDFDSEVAGARFTMDQGYDQDPQTWSQVGGRCSLRELVRRSLVVSGNLATNLVLERVGTAAVADLLAAAGCSEDTRLARGIEDAPAGDAGLCNTVTARDLGRLLAGLGTGVVIGDGPSQEVESVLTQQTHRDAIPAGLPPGTYIANKTGWVDGVTHDLALVRPSDEAAFVLVVLTHLDRVADGADGVIAGVARQVWTSGEWR